MSETRREQLLARKKQIEAKLRQLEARERQQARKDDTRRKIIAGALALEHAEIDAEFGAQMAKLLNRYVTKPRERALFDLPPRPDKDQDLTPATAANEPSSPGQTFSAATGTNPPGKA